METEDPREPLMIRSRRCARCGRTKPLAEFVKQPTQKLGRGYHCKRCAADRVTAWRRRREQEAAS